MRLLDAEDFTGGCLRKLAAFDEAIDLQREMRLELLALGVRKSQIGKDIAAAFLNPVVGSLGHRQFCLSP